MSPPRPASPPTATAVIAATSCRGRRRRHTWLAPSARHPPPRDNDRLRVVGDGHAVRHTRFRRRSADTFCAGGGADAEDCLAAPASLRNTQSMQPFTPAKSCGGTWRQSTTTTAARRSPTRWGHWPRRCGHGRRPLPPCPPPPWPPARTRAPCSPLQPPPRVADLPCIGDRGDAARHQRRRRRLAIDLDGGRGGGRCARHPLDARPTAATRALVAA